MTNYPELSAENNSAVDAAFDAWARQNDPRMYPAERQAFEAGWKAAQQDASAAQAVPDGYALPYEQALSELVNKIDTGLDTGDLLTDARRASAALDGIMTAGDLVANAHDHFKQAGVLAEHYEMSTDFRIGWNACLDAISHARAAYAVSLADRPSEQAYACETCDGKGTIDETLCGESFSDPNAECPDRDGKGEWYARESSPAIAPADAPQLAEGCHRSHPHENMDAACQRLTEEARSRHAPKGEPVAEVRVDESHSQTWIALKTQWLPPGVHKLFLRHAPADTSAQDAVAMHAMAEHASDQDIADALGIDLPKEARDRIGQLIYGRGYAAGRKKGREEARARHDTSAPDSRLERDAELWRHGERLGFPQRWIVRSPISGNIVWTAPGDNQVEYIRAEDAMRAAIAAQEKP